MRKLVGVIISVRENGSIEPLVSFFDIEKETEKMIYPKITRERFGDREAIRWLSQVRKAELGDISERSYQHQFSYQCHDVVETQEELIALIEKVKEKVRGNIEKRTKLNESWRNQFSNLKIDGEL
jgi:hypothetical protein